MHQCMNGRSGRSPGKMTTLGSRLPRSRRSLREPIDMKRESGRALSFELYELITRAAYLSSKPKLTRQQISAPL
jgi:hypothetical protein